MWLGLKEGKGALFVVIGVSALGLYGVVASFQPSNEFGRVLAVDLIGAALCLVGVGTIMYAPR